ncbi:MULTISPECIES: hypothetical protein [Pontibacter]|uniref:Winged helix-turn-helix domain n=1 Tax=Pontibacter lucknowensis TaxID=1077936 RepID=A0A1N7AMR2_9BACT|nr:MULTISPECIES: hypothetical protein [Pontibacter]EJF08206.1 hypothetical protein O71_22294 [Pontibacter sp. BAB1700]SIR40288.1 hypothetical protein SAMN05421545_3437 [Pontibacter lucknowensis]
MEEDKKKYLDALRKNNGKLDERALGESLGFSKEYTDELIEALMADEKIEYSAGQNCSYKVKE